jgi:hypothetical protein
LSSAEAVKMFGELVGSKTKEHETIKR